jgi:hypothetical protein
MVKIREVGRYTIWYKIYYLTGSRRYEVLRSDVSSILYYDGRRDYFSSPDDSLASVQSSGMTSDSSGPKKYDPSSSSVIYFLFDYRSDESTRYPLYFNGKYICTLKNHSRLKYTTHSRGPLKIQKLGKKGREEGPTVLLKIEPGKSYGINILMMNPQSRDPNIKFFCEVINDGPEITHFIESEFYGLVPYKENDFVMEEDKNDPLIY